MIQRSVGTLLVVVVLVLGSVPEPALGQTPAVSPAVLTAPASTRAMALGGAYMMNAGHADALFHHPALLTGASGFGLEWQTWGGEGSATAASAAMAWLGGGVGIGLQTLQGGMPTRFVPARQDPLFTHGPVAVSERVATVGYARTFFGVQVGASGKLVEERLDGAKSSAVLVDVGVARSVGPITVGLTVKDIGNDPFETDGNGGPSRIVLGAGAYGKELGPLDVGFTGAVSYASEETLVGGGLEFGYWPINGRTFVARVGLQAAPDGSAADPVTLGFAFWGDDLVLEWAYQGFGDLDDGTHRFGVRWR